MTGLPFFFVIGAQKAGTTSLHDWLNQQPEVCLPGLKETHFFSHDHIFERGLNWYSRQFKTAGKTVIGEVDPEYLFSEKAPLRIKELAVSPRFIVIFRNPVERAYSHYLMTVRRGLEDLSFIEALRAEDARLKDGGQHALDNFSYISRGMYCGQVKRYLDAFPGSEFLFIKFEDMVGRETGAVNYERICKFIGVKSEPTLADRNKHCNMASSPKWIFIRDLLYKQSPLRKLGARLLPRDLKHKAWMVLDRLNQAPLKGVKTEIKVLPRPVLEVIKDDIRALERTTGLDLASWREKLNGYL